MYIKRTKCKFCGFLFNGLSTSKRANHTRWCASNPSRDRYVEGLVKARAGITDESLDKMRRSIIKAHVDGRYAHCDKRTFLGKTHSEATKKKISEKALASNHRRLLRSVREYTKKDGTKVLLDSSWEEVLARRLDSLDVEWIRPTQPIKYITEDGKTRNYFPDFYLPHYDIFLDPKNPAAVAAQKNKLDILKKTLYNLVIIYSLDDCRNYNPVGVV